MPEQHDPPDHSTGAAASDPGWEEIPDSVLARRAGMGDRQAFTIIFDRHGPAMFRYALHMLDADTADAEDALQNVWIKAWTHLGDFRGRAQLRTWLFTLTAHEVRNHRRRRRPLLVEDSLLDARPGPEAAGPAESFDHLQVHEALTLALTELPWRQRASWILREVEGLTYEEIAVALDTSTTVVRGQLHRARAALATRMEMWR